MRSSRPWSPVLSWMKLTDKCSNRLWLNYISFWTTSRCWYPLHLGLSGGASRIRERLTWWSGWYVDRWRVIRRNSSFWLSCRWTTICLLVRMAQYQTTFVMSTWRFLEESSLHSGKCSQKMNPNRYSSSNLPNNLSLRRCFTTFCTSFRWISSTPNAS